VSPVVLYSFLAIFSWY